MPGIIDAEKVHDTLKHAAASLDDARRNFEKARWASARTDADFESWLGNGQGRDLAEPKKQAIKQASTESIENAIAEALSSLLGEKYKASVVKIDFTHLNQLGAVGLVPIELQISLVNPFPDAI